ncbi:MAG: flagellar basal body P-ring formation protein FlgA [candidate division Zixibacteria bacterium]|nr:flagellar basal body P-ring formation protein FlgA [candidate division Zixibacteria bacterium]
MITYLLALTIICTPASDKVEQAIRTYVQGNFAIDNAEFQYDFRRINWSLLPSELDSVKIFRIGKDSPFGTTIFTLGIYNDGDLAKAIPVSVGVTLSVDALVTRTTINVGDKLQDLVLENRTITGRNEMPLTDLTLLEGKQARKYIRPGSIIYPSMIENIPVLKLGDKVKILIEKGSIIVTADGLVRQKGSTGDIIRVVNTGSKKTIKAEIIDSLTVAVR